MNIHLQQSALIQPKTGPTKLVARALHFTSTPPGFLLHSPAAAESLLSTCMCIRHDGCNLEGLSMAIFFSAFLATFKRWRWICQRESIISWMPLDWPSSTCFCAKLGNACLLAEPRPSRSCWPGASLKTMLQKPSPNEVRIFRGWRGVLQTGHHVQTPGPGAGGHPRWFLESHQRDSVHTSWTLGP